MDIIDESLPWPAALLFPGSALPLSLQLYPELIQYYTPRSGHGRATECPDIMATDQDVVPLDYYEAPHSLQDMDSRTFSGLLTIGSFATISVLFTSALLSFITWRLIAWKSHYQSSIQHNQPLILVYQLLWADFLQSLGFLISFHWAAGRQITGPSGVCFAQGWLIQLGDVASAFFVLAIAVHTTAQVILSRSVSYRVLIYGIVGIWVFALLLTALAPIIGGRFIFLRAGMWVSYFPESLPCSRPPCTGIMADTHHSVGSRRSTRVCGCCSTTSGSLLSSSAPSSSTRQGSTLFTGLRPSGPVPS